MLSQYLASPELIPYIPIMWIGFSVLIAMWIADSSSDMSTSLSSEGDRNGNHLSLTIIDMPLLYLLSFAFLSPFGVTWRIA